MVFVRRHASPLRGLADSGRGGGGVLHAAPLRDVADSSRGGGRGVAEKGKGEKRNRDAVMDKGDK